MGLRAKRWLTLSSLIRVIAIIGLVGALNVAAQRPSDRVAVPALLRAEITLAPTSMALTEADAVEVTSTNIGPGRSPEQASRQDHAAMIQWIDASRLAILNSGTLASRLTVEPAGPHRTFLNGLHQGSENLFSTRARWNVRVRHDASPGQASIVLNSVPIDRQIGDRVEANPTLFHQRFFGNPTSSDVTVSIEVRE